MPFIHIRLSGRAFPHATLEALSREALALSSSILRKQADLTSVLIEPTPRAALGETGPGTGLWTVGAITPPVAAHLEISVTAGTNTPAEKAAFIAAAAEMLRRALGEGLSPATYVVVREIGGDCWGYDGRSQAARLTMHAEHTI